MTCINEGNFDAKTRLTKYEKETIILTCEEDDTYSAYTFNTVPKRRLADFAKKYQVHCHLISEKT